MAYAAVVSLGQTLDHVLHPDRHLIIHDKKVFESLRRKVSFLQIFLEKSPRGGDDELEILAAKIRDAAYKAEDIIESHVYKFKSVSLFRIPDLAINSYAKMLVFLQIMMPFSGVYERGMAFMDKMFRCPYFGLEKLMKEMDSILDEVKAASERCRDEEDQRSGESSSASCRSRRLNFGHGGDPVGMDGDFLTIMERLTGPASRREVIPIVGMGGIGKTTLAKRIYDDRLVSDHFDACAWVTVSQVYDIHDILLQLLNSLRLLNEKIHSREEDGVAEHLYKTLCGRRYLIVMDDLWSDDAWDDFIRYFPDNNNGSRIVLTTRLESVAKYANSGSRLHYMRLLCDCESWDLLSAKVFGDEGCPDQLSEVGRQIAFGCEGLPLAVVLMAGILSKVNETPEEWKKVAENLHSVVNKDADTCLQILSFSYNHLPEHLKPCFLYMGAFPEDSRISVSKVVKLWAAEGFLKQNEAKTLEEVAEEYILELAERSLITVHDRRGEGYYSKIKIINIHDHLRDLCIREARKEKLLHVVKSPVDGLPRDQRCICIYPSIPVDDPFFECYNRVSTPNVWSISYSFARSLLYTGQNPISSLMYHGFKLLRVLDISRVLFFKFPVEILKLYNLRYLAFAYHGEVPESISQLWNLQTLIFSSLLKNFAPCARPLPLAIWSMPRLRHLRFHAWYLSEFPCLLPGWKTSAFLANLQTLSDVHASICQKEVLQEMPNLKTLGIWMETWDAAPFYINNLACLQKLEVLKCSVRSFPTQEVRVFPTYNYNSPPQLAFPAGLKELSLRSCRIPWGDMTMVGSLPNLEKLKLRDHAFVGPDWEPTEGEFGRLNFLYIDGSDLERWNADSIHFPLLKFLIVENCWRLEAVPYGIGEIPTLQNIEIDESSTSAVASAKEILEEQESSGNYGLRLYIYPVGTFP